MKPSQNDWEWKLSVEKRLMRLEYLLIAAVFAMYSTPWVSHIIGVAFGVSP